MKDLQFGVGVLVYKILDVKLAAFKVFVAKVEWHFGGRRRWANHQIWNDIIRGLKEHEICIFANSSVDTSGM